MIGTAVGSLGAAVAQHPNDHDSWTGRFAAGTGVGWHEPTPPRLSAGRSVSVVMPACDVGYCLPTVLDALARQDYRGAIEVIVVDDFSTDDTAAIAGTHPVVDVVVRLAARHGPAVARNAGVRVAGGDTVLFCDADMVLPGHVLADVAARAAAGLLLVGFRHDIAWQPDQFGRVIVPDGRAEVSGDPRAHWHPAAAAVAGDSGESPSSVSVLDATRDLQGLGYGLTYAGWDLPRMVEARLLAVPRAAVVEVGGFAPAFAAPGLEGALLGAVLVCLGLLVVPLRQVVGWHVLPPDPAGAWHAKQQVWPELVQTYRQRLTEPAPTGRAATFARAVDHILASAHLTSRAGTR